MVEVDVLYQRTCTGNSRYRKPNSVARSNMASRRKSSVWQVLNEVRTRQSVVFTTIFNAPAKVFEIKTVKRGECKKIICSVDSSPTEMKVWLLAITAGPETVDNNICAVIGQPAVLIVDEKRWVVIKIEKECTLDQGWDEHAILQILSVVLYARA